MTGSRASWAGRRGWRVLALGVLAIGPLACDHSPCRDPKVELAKLDYTLKDMDGHDVQLASFKGRPLIINFWATWCGPCKEEIPTLIVMAEKYKARHLAILGVSIDDKSDELKKFAAEYKMNYPVLVGLGHDDFIEAYGAEVTIPVSWFVTPCGSVSVKHTGLGSRDWFEQQIQGLF